MPDPFPNDVVVYGAKGDPLRCPDCGTTIQGTDDATCANGHKPVRLAWFEVCACGHDTHYDMTTFCLTADCGCQEWEPSDRCRQLVIRRV